MAFESTEHMPLSGHLLPVSSLGFASENDKAEEAAEAAAQCPGR